MGGVSVGNSGDTKPGGCCSLLAILLSKQKVWTLLERVETEEHCPHGWVTMYFPVTFTFPSISNTGACISLFKRKHTIKGRANM